MVTHTSTTTEYHELLDAFFARHPDVDHEYHARRTLNVLLDVSDALPGKPAGWVGGLVFMILKWPTRTPFAERQILINWELEHEFGVSISTIRKRAEHVWQRIRPHLDVIVGS